MCCGGAGASERTKEKLQSSFPSYFQFELKRHKRNQLVSIHGLVLCELLIKYNSRPFFGNSRNIIGFSFFLLLLAGCCCCAAAAAAVAVAAAIVLLLLLFVEPLLQ